MKEELLKKQNGKCALCGAENTEMVFEHIIPVVAGGSDSIDNLVLICKHHNSFLANRNLREFEFSDFIVRLMNENESFTNVNREVLLNPEKRHRADIVAEEIIGSNKKAKLLIELKSFSNFTRSRFEGIVRQLETYGDQIEDEVKKIFAFPGIISEGDKEIFTSNNIEVWDLNYLFDRFKNQISKPYNQKFLSFYGMLSSQEKLSEEKKLIEDLKAIKPGRDDWSKYQNHIGKILDYLFGDNLSSPIVESSDEFGVNRRDFIIRNYVDSGFWKYLRDRYKADFIVIDAKNYTKEVKKKEVLQISNYLKEQGTGLFALIISRVGEKKSSYMTRRDKWVIENKMVIVLKDDDIEQMILAKASSNDPEEIIKQRIEEFRLKI